LMRRTWPLAAIAGVVTLALALAGLAPGPTQGQSNPSATPSPTGTASAVSSATASATSTAAATPSAQAAPAIDNETAVRIVLPAQVSNATTLPGKWARADMPYAPGGYVVF